MSLLIDELGHGLAFLLVAYYVSLSMKLIYSNKNLLIGLFATYFIDADHLLDYFLDAGFKIDFVAFFTGGYFETNGKIFVLFHAWEYAVLLFAFFLLAKDKVKYSWVFFLFLALMVHLIYDVASYNFDPIVYSIGYRLYKGFDISAFFS